MIRAVEPVPFSQVNIQDEFWSPRLQKHATATLDVCMDQIENQTARIQNFERAASKTGQHEGIFFDDSDVYKAMEGMAYSLVNNPNPNVEQKLDEWIDKIAAAQQPDGYLNTYYTLTGLDKRWTNMDKHEMYCGGHMIEAAIAYHQATGKRKFLDVAIRFANHLNDVFGEGKRQWVPGHQEIELALVKLYHATDNENYLALADHLLSGRGYGYGANTGYISDTILNKEKVWWAGTPEYCQDDVPVRNQSVIAGHAVRAMYMYCGMADVAAITHDTGYMAALDRLWENVVKRNMYITGGIGSSRHNEGFTKDYDLPNEEAYCETCASIGMVFWNHRMNQLTGNSKYVDVLERSLYNGALAGVSLSGDQFFYVNPLEAKEDHRRQAWFGCACCPSQVSRFLPSVGGYIYGQSADALWVNLFIGSATNVALQNNNVRVQQQTHYPWDGKVVLTITPEKSNVFQVKVRKPDWSKTYTASVNGEKTVPTIGTDGYLTFERTWSKDDQLELNWDMTPEMVAADPRVLANTGKRAIQRGPLVYCMEETDNPAIDAARLHVNSTLTVNSNPDLLGGINTITADSTLNYIPYYAWANRASGKMKVWINLD